MDSVDIETKDNEWIRFPGNYFMGVSRFRGQLNMCGYPVNNKAEQVLSNND
jgi:hypothetical protein